MLQASAGAHPILGIIVTALVLINPTMALFRPHPGTAHRPIFNWAHFLVGTVARILGVVTIFFGKFLFANVLSSRSRSSNWSRR